jgi:hypothetical protein
MENGWSDKDFQQLWKNKNHFKAVSFIPMDCFYLILKKLKADIFLGWQVIVSYLFCLLWKENKPAKKFKDVLAAWQIRNISEIYLYIKNVTALKHWNTAVLVY